MLRRLESIDNCGIFESFRWNSETREFQRINLILASNGSGKTSLASALGDLSREDDGYLKVSIRLSDADGNRERVTDHKMDAEFERLFVFSDRYVSQSHRFEGSPEMDAVLTLGDKTIEAEARISELNKLIETRQADLDQAKEAIAGNDRRLDAAFKAVRNAVVTDLSRAGGEYKSNGTYGARVRSRFSDPDSKWTLLTETELAANKQIVVSDSRPELPQVKVNYGVRLRPEFNQEAQDLLDASPVSIILDTLQAHPEASSWVEAGQQHHHETEVCIFCGSALTEERKLQIQAHFSREVITCQEDLDRVIGELRTLQRQLDAVVADAPDPGLLFEDLRDAYEAELDAVKESVKLLRAWTEPVLKALSAKRANVLEASHFIISESPVVDGTQLASRVQSHNEHVTNHDALVQEAARRVEQHHLRSARDNIKELQGLVVEAHKKQEGAGSDLSAYRSEVASLEAVEGDPLPSAQTLTREVGRLLGRSELDFELVPGGTKYRVMRHGQPALNLSTGERRAITLVHFLEGVRNAPSETRPIVIIDDPVSSLDSNVSTGISSYIWNEAVVKGHIDQVFVLTHNFELFKQWDLQIDGLDRNAALRKAYPSERYELTAPHVTASGHTRRVPKFSNWPPTGDAKRKLRSSYHHAFIMVARAAIAIRDEDSVETRLDALLVYPNLIRRMLESFLAFKRPELVGNFTDSMRSSGEMLLKAKYKGDPEPIRLRLTRFTHAYSHDESPETDVTLNPDEIGPTMSAVFTFMHALDEQHFAGLCQVAGFNPQDLLPQIVAKDEDPEEGKLFSG